MSGLHVIPPNSIQRGFAPLDLFIADIFIRDMVECFDDYRVSYILRAHGL